MAQPTPSRREVVYSSTIEIRQPNTSGNPYNYLSLNVRATNISNWSLISGTRISPSDVGKYIFFTTSTNSVIGRIEDYTTKSSAYNLIFSVVYTANNTGVSGNVVGSRFAISDDTSYPPWGMSIQVPVPVPSTQPSPAPITRPVPPPAPITGPVPPPVTRREVFYSSSITSRIPGPSWENPYTFVTLNVPTAKLKEWWGGANRISTSDIGSFIFFMTSGSLIIGRIESFDEETYGLPITVLRNSGNIPISTTGGFTVTNSQFGISTDMNFPTWGYPWPWPSSGNFVTIGPVGSLLLRLDSAVGSFTIRHNANRQRGNYLPGAATGKFLYFLLNNTLRECEITSIPTTSNDTLISFTDGKDLSFFVEDVDFAFSPSQIGISSIRITNFYAFETQFTSSPAPGTGNSPSPVCTPLTNVEPTSALYYWRDYVNNEYGYKIIPDTTDGCRRAVRIGINTTPTPSIETLLESTTDRSNFTYLTCESIQFKIISYGTTYIYAYAVNPSISISNQINTFSPIEMYGYTQPISGFQPGPGMVQPAPNSASPSSSTGAPFASPTSSTGPSMTPTSSTGPAMTPTSSTGPTMAPTSSTGPAMTPTSSTGPTMAPTFASPSSTGAAPFASPSSTGPTMAPAAPNGPSIAPAVPFRETRITPVATFKNIDGKSIIVKNVYKPDGTGYRHVTTFDGSSSKGPFFNYTVQDQKIYITYRSNGKRLVSSKQPEIGSEPV